MAAGAAAGLSGVPATAAGGIEKSILISMLPAEMPYLDRFKLAVDVGFHLMEVRTVDDSEAPKIKDAADKAGLRIHSVMNQAHWRHPLSSPNAAEVDTSLEGMRRSLRQAKLHGADAVLLVPAVVHGDTTYEQAWERIAEADPYARAGGREARRGDRHRGGLEQIPAHRARLQPIHRRVR